MTKRRLIDFCLTYPSAFEDYPFDDVTPVIKHAGNGKMFALVGEDKSGRASISLKCDPQEADFLRSVYKDVTPGYHFNKKHWNTVITGGDVPEAELIRMIEASYNLIKPKVRRVKKEEK